MKYLKICFNYGKPQTNFQISQGIFHYKINFKKIKPSNEYKFKQKNSRRFTNKNQIN